MQKTQQANISAKEFTDMYEENLAIAADDQKEFPELTLHLQAGLMTLIELGETPTVDKIHDMQVKYLLAKQYSVLEI